MSADNTIVHANTWDLSTVTVRGASTFGLTLGEIRRFVREADALGIPDKETVYLEGVRQSHIRANERMATTVLARWQRPSGESA